MVKFEDFNQDCGACGGYGHDKDCPTCQGKGKKPVKELIPIEGVPDGYEFSEIAISTGTYAGERRAYFLHTTNIEKYKSFKLPYTQGKEYTFTCECSTLSTRKLQDGCEKGCCSWCFYLAKGKCLKCPSCKGKPEIKAIPNIEVVNHSFDITWKEVV